MPCRASANSGPHCQTLDIPAGHGLPQLQRDEPYDYGGQYQECLDRGKLRAVLAWAPLASGFLTGEFDLAALAPDDLRAATAYRSVGRASSVTSDEFSRREKLELP